MDDEEQEEENPEAETHEAERERFSSETIKDSVLVPEIEQKETKYALKDELAENSEDPEQVFKSEVDLEEKQQTDLSGLDQLDLKTLSGATLKPLLKEVLIRELANSEHQDSD